MRPLVLTVACVALFATPARAQWVVHDPGNFAQAVLIAERTLSELNSLLKQYETIVRMSRGLPTLDPYRIPTIGTARHDLGKFEYGRVWLDAFNSGDPTGQGYVAVARRLQPPAALLAALPPAARQAIERAYATVEISDSVAQLGAHQIGAVRGYAGALQHAIDALEFDVTALLPGYRDATAVLDKIAGGQLVARRQDMAVNQLLSHILEQLLARAKRQRDTEAASMNMRLLAIRDARRVQSTLLNGAANDLTSWRQP
jgi:hypothetical protein